MPRAEIRKSTSSAATASSYSLCPDRRVPQRPPEGGLFFFCLDSMKRALALGFLFAFVPAAHADLAAGKREAEACSACHGADGNAAIAQFPVLAGQTARYLYLQLKDFKEGRRSEPSMAPFVAKLSTRDMLDLAEYFAAQKPKPIAFKADAARIARGRKKADEVLCTMCHLGGFSGQNEIPRVAG